MGKRNQESLFDEMNIQQHLKEILARRLMLWDLVLGAVKMTPDSLNLCKDFVEFRQRNKQKKPWEMDYLAFLNTPVGQIFPSKIVLELYILWEIFVFNLVL